MASPPDALCEDDDLNDLGLGDDFTAQFSSDELLKNRKAYSVEAVNRLKPAVVPPLLEWGDDIRSAVAKIVAYEIMSLKGLAPANVTVGDANVYLRAQQAREYLSMLGKAGSLPEGVVDSSGTGKGSGRVMMPHSDDPIGWC